MESPDSDEGSVTPSLLCLPDDALVRIFFYLGSPLPYYESFLGPQHADVPDSSAGALARTCRRLAALHRTRVVSCVDLSRTSCSCSLPAALRFFPSVDAAVLGSLRESHATTALRGKGAQCMSRLRSLCLTAVPSEDFVDTLIATVPQLRALDVQAMGNFMGGSASKAGLLRLLGNLLKGLRRLSLYYPSIASNEGMDVAL